MSQRWWFAGVAATTLVVVVLGMFAGMLIDLQVYRTGGQSWLHGVPLFAVLVAMAVTRSRLPMVGRQT